MVFGIFVIFLWRKGVFFVGGFFLREGVGEGRVRFVFLDLFYRLLFFFFENEGGDRGGLERCMDGVFFV